LKHALEIAYKINEIEISPGVVCAYYNDGSSM